MAGLNQLISAVGAELGYSLIT